MIAEHGATVMIPSRFSSNVFRIGKLLAINGAILVFHFLFGAAKGRFMKHVIFGGDGYVGRYLARDLLAIGEEVIICDVRKSDLPIYPRARFVHSDITDRASIEAAPVAANDIVYNLAARMLHPIVPR
ncbi:MAG: NAD-dependent epimerase/dehydratase family protein, partial [Burkholderiales bacterium]